MTSPLAHRLLFWLALAAYAVAGVLPGGGVVLCIEPDGHVSIESPEAGCADCCVGDEADAGAETSISACPCRDLSLGSARIACAKIRTSETLGGEQAVPVSTGIERAPVPLAKNEPRILRRVPRNSPVECVRSVVLRV